MWLMVYIWCVFEFVVGIQEGEDQGMTMWVEMFMAGGV